MDRARTLRKLEALVAAWRERFGAEPTRAELHLAFAVAEHETRCGDAWPGTNNWGALQKERLSDAQKAHLAMLGIQPGATWTTEGKASLARATAALGPQEEAVLKPDSSPAKGDVPARWYFVWFWAPKTEAKGASLFLEALAIKRPSVRPALASGDPARVAEAMYREGYYEGFHAPAAEPGEVVARGALTRGQQANVTAYTTALRGQLAALEAALADTPPPKAAPPMPTAIDLSYRRVIEGENREDRVVRIAYHLADLNDRDSRALYEKGARDVPWTCMIFCREVMRDACLSPEDGANAVVMIGNQTFGVYGDDEDRTILGSLLYRTGAFIDGRQFKATTDGAGKKTYPRLPVRKGSFFWQSAPGGGNDHVGVICAVRERPNGDLDLDTAEGGQAGDNAQRFTRVWRYREDGRLTNVGASGSPAPGASVIQGIALADELPILGKRLLTPAELAIIDIMRTTGLVASLDEIRAWVQAHPAYVPPVA